MKNIDDLKMIKNPQGIRFDWIENEVTYTRFVSFSRDHDEFKKEFNDLIRYFKKKGFIKISDEKLKALLK